MPERTPNEGDHVRVTSGDHAGRTGTYEGYREDAFGEWHLVHLDGDTLADVALRVDSVEVSADAG